MKSMFSQMVQFCSTKSTKSLMFQGKRLMLFLVAAIIFPVALSASSSSTKYDKLTINVTSSNDEYTGKGKVYVTTTATGASENPMSSSSIINYPTVNSGEKVDGVYIFNYGVKLHPIGKNSFLKSFTADNSTCTVTSGGNYAGNISVDANYTSETLTYYITSSSNKDNINSPHSASATAVFDRIIHIDAPGVSFDRSDPDMAYVANLQGGDGTFAPQTYNILLQKGSSFLPPSIRREDGGNVQVSATINSADGNHTLTIAPLQDEIVETADYIITLRGNDGGEIDFLWTINMTAPIVTLHVNPYATYRYTKGNNSGETIASTESDVEAELEVAADYNIKFELVESNSAYKFHRWRVVYKNGTSSTYFGTTETISFTGGEHVYLDMVDANRAFFIVKGHPTIKYVDLQEAVEASKSKTEVVIVETSGTLVTGNYTINDGVTLLVPGDANYTYTLGNITTTHTTQTDEFKEYCRLEVAANTTITVDGASSAIVVPSKLYSPNGGGSRAGGPTSYGHIVMGDKSQIIVQNNGLLHALGYITGASTSKVTMKNTTTLYEAFQFNEWLGGTKMGQVATEIGVNFIIDNRKYKGTAFPVQQYYIQNVEVALQIEYGATEYVSSSVTMSSNMTPMTALMIGKDNTEGLFCLKDGMYIVRSYDPIEDRIKYEFNTNISDAELNIKYITMSVGGTELASRFYVLPITNNMDVVINNGIKAYLSSHLALLPDATLSLATGAEGNLQANQDFFIYDADQKTTTETTQGGYFGLSNSKLLPLGNRPGGMRNPKRSADNLKDAKVEINGTLNVYGSLYTTLGGADITSTSGGKINVYNIGTNTDTKQRKDGSTTLISIPLSSPNLKLHNNTALGANNEYTEVEKTGEQNLSTKPLEYSYRVSDGTWHLPIAGISSVKLYDNSGNEVLLTSPYKINLPTENFEGYLLCDLMNVDGLTYALSQFAATVQENTNYITLGSLGLQNNQLKIPVTYTNQNTHGVFENTIQITTTIPGYELQTMNQKIQFEENYTPEFDVSPTALTFEPTTVGTAQSKSLSIIYDSDKILSLTSGSAATVSEEGDKYVLTGHNQKIVWTATFEGEDKEEFAFTFGDATSDFNSAEIQFLANNAHTSSATDATLVLTAQYTDEDAGDAPAIVEKRIPLTAYANKVGNTLKYADFPAEIYPTTNPFELLKDKNSDGTIQLLSPTNNDIVSITKDEATGTYWVDPISEGEVKVHVKQDETDKYAGTDLGERTIVVRGNQKPTVEKESPICVNEDNFIPLTIAKDKMDFTDGQLVFEAYSSWTLYFEGVAGSIQFTPQQDAIWTIEESATNMVGAWKEIVAQKQYKANETVVLPLAPTTQYIKISSTTGGVLNDLCIYALTINVSDDKLYMPYYRNMSPATSSKDITITYSSEEEVTLQSSDERITLSPSTLAAAPEYAVQKITITSEVYEQGDFAITIPSGDGEVYTLPIYTYLFPQPLPIMTQTWENEHMYFYHLIKQNHVQWNQSNKQLEFLNPGNDLNPRSFVFGFYGYPDVVQFESATDTWKVQYSVTGEDNAWRNATAEATPIAESSNKLIKAAIPTTSRFVKITYDYADLSMASINNLVVEGSPTVEVLEPQSAELILTPNLEEDVITGTVTLRVTNLAKMLITLDNTRDFKISHKSDEIISTGTVLDSEDYAFLALNESGEITLTVTLLNRDMVNEGYIRIFDDETKTLLATVRLLGKKDLITQADAKTGIRTGVAPGYELKGSNFEPYTYHEVDITHAFDKDQNPMFDYLFIYGETTTMDGTGEITIPTKSSGSNAMTPYYVYRKIITETEKGYEFVEAVENANSQHKNILTQIEHQETINREEDAISYALRPIGDAPLNVYITGFCPYATTGSTKDEEGVWYFRGDPEQTLNIYLEDCHIYSRNKSEDGRTTEKNVSPSFAGSTVVLGSGAVFVFENSNSSSGSQPFNVSIHTRGRNLLKSNFGCYYTLIGDAQVTQVSSPIQIRLGSNMELNTASTVLNFDDIWPYGKVNDVEFTSRTNGFISLQKLVNNAPSIDLGNPNTVVNFNGGQVELQNAQIVSPNYKTTLAISHRSGEFGNFKYPFAYGLGTDDVGGTVNFNDGTTTVIPMTVDAAYRSFYLMDTEQAKDKDGNLMFDEAGNPIMVELATTSCLRCPVNTFVHGGSHCMIRACAHVTSKGGAPKDNQGKALGRYIYQNTEEQGYTYDCVVEHLPADFVGYGEGDYVLYDDDQDGKYNKWQVQTENGTMVWKKGEIATSTDPCYIVKPNNFPGTLVNKDGLLLADYHKAYPKGQYGLQSITPDKKGNLYFWIPEGYVAGVSPEKDKLITVWKACMTEITAGEGALTGTIGGETYVAEDEEVTNLLYCQLDENIYKVISDSVYAGEVDGKPKYNLTYEAPVVDPTGKLSEEEKYQRIIPTTIGSKAQEEVTSEKNYEITNKIYYVTTALADTWMNFTMPFDVQKIWIVESYSESAIEDYFTSQVNLSEENPEIDPTEETLKFQARHNADFAAFFGVAMAVGADHLSFEDIYNNYIDWAKNRADAKYENPVTLRPGTDLYDGTGKYGLRGMYPLTHYDGTNFKKANFYLYKNVGDWTITKKDGTDQFTTNWQIVPNVPEKGVLMEKGATYSMLFPFCQGCDVEIETEGENRGEVVLDEDGFPVQKERDYWDYWSGKFIIFESTTASLQHPHIINGANYVAEQKVEDNQWLFDNYKDAANSAMLLGNSTFANMPMELRDLKDRIYTYKTGRGTEHFDPYEQEYDEENNRYYYPVINPTSTFLLTGAISTPIKLIARSGRIVFDESGDNNGNQNGTTGNMPTIGGGNDMFITAIEGGINIAVAAPQVVRVLSSTGSVIFAGTITTATDVLLPTSGIYIISGENEVQKILH